VPEIPFLVSFLIIDLVFGVLAYLSFTWGFMIPMVFVLIGLALNLSIQVQLLQDPKGGLSFVKGAVEDDSVMQSVKVMFRNTIHFSGFRL